MVVSISKVHQLIMAKPKLRNPLIVMLIGLVVIFAGYKFLFGKNDLKEQDQWEESVANLTAISQEPSLNDSIVNYGKELLNTPYVIAGTSEKGFDCSGYIYYVFQQFNIEVPRSTSGYENFGKEIPVELVEKGDLLLFLSPTRNAIGHIGIVSKANGASSEFIHASSGKAMKVIITNLSNEGYTRRFVKAIRVL